MLRETAETLGLADFISEHFPKGFHPPDRYLSPVFYEDLMHKDDSTNPTPIYQELIAEFKAENDKQTQQTQQTQNDKEGH